MKKYFLIQILLILFFSSCLKINAQLDSLSMGDKIRILATNYFLQPTIATFEKATDDSLSFNLHKRNVVIPLNIVRKLELSTGKNRNTTIGMIAGSIIGGAILGLVMKNEDNNAKGFGKVGQPGFWGGFASGVIIGGGIGAFIGYHYVTDNWQEIRISKKIEF